MTAVDRMPTLTVPVPSRENARAKAIRLVVEGRVRVRLVRAGRVYVEVRGDSGRTHAVKFSQGRWSCSCRATACGCSHMRAVWLVVSENPKES